MVRKNGPRPPLPKGQKPRPRGGSPPRRKATLSGLSRQWLKSGEGLSLGAEFTGGSDRSVALVGAATVDHCLAMALVCTLSIRDAAHTDSLFYKSGAPLSNFSARIAVGRAVGLFGDTIETKLTIIRRVRNTFAHSVRPLLFTEPLIAAECMKLPETRWEQPPGWPELSIPRKRFSSHCMAIASTFSVYANNRVGKPLTIELEDAPESLLGPDAHVS